MTAHDLQVAAAMMRISEPPGSEAAAVADLLATMADEYTDVMLDSRTAADRVADLVTKNPVRLLAVVADNAEVMELLLDHRYPKDPTGSSVAVLISNFLKHHA